MHQFFLSLVFPTFYSPAVALLKMYCEKQGWDLIFSISSCKMIFFLYFCLRNHGNCLSTWASAARVSPCHSWGKGCPYPCSQLQKAPLDLSHSFLETVPVSWTFCFTWWDRWASHIPSNGGSCEERMTTKCNIREHNLCLTKCQRNLAVPLWSSGEICQHVFHRKTLTSRFQSELRERGSSLSTNAGSWGKMSDLCFFTRTEPWVQGYLRLNTIMMIIANIYWKLTLY